MKTRTNKKIKNLNLTSMLDVCFLLLIFFVLTANFAHSEGYLPADLPHPGTPSHLTPPPIPDQPVHIYLDSLGATDCMINVDSEQFDNFTALYQYLDHHQFRSNNLKGIYSSDTPIIIHAKNNVIYGHVLNAYNATLHAKYKNISFAQPNQ